MNNINIENIKNEEWYQSIVEDCQAIITETVFISRQALIEGKHQVGERICADSNFKKILGGRGKHSFLKQIIQDIGIGRSEGYSCVSFYEKFPKLSTAMDSFKEQKNISWTKIKQNYLPEIKEGKEIIELPKGEFNVIYADPPWRYDVDLSSGSTREPENNYPTMSLDELITFGDEVIKKITNKDCVLFMWITAPKLNWMIDVLNAWGFEYKTNLIWDKVKHNMGHYSSVRHEILIIAGKGKCAPTCDGKTIQSVDSVQSIEKSARHSEKPKEFYEIIQKLYPEGKAIELFNRGGAYNNYWTVYGNESTTNK